ncbi:dihydrofolate reductase family protein [Flavitalea sp.]|nr:dihydrofolate reductase family protein [Flavitalea sp.]
MRKIIVTTFISLDGVMQGPGGPEEDPTNGFKWGGWTATFWDEIMNNKMAASMKNPYDLLLGRKTYEIFASHWPYADDPISETFNRITKYVVSGKGLELTWKNAVLITGDIVAKLAQLRKEDGPDLLVNGSGKLVQTLLSNGLVDLLYLWIFPTTIGKGKRLFEEGTSPANWELLESTTSTTGVIIASYKPSGAIKLGSFALEPPTEAELIRREKMKREL